MMATAELNEMSTHEDITQAVEQIIEDRQDDSHEKGDATLIAEERDQPVTTAEEDSGSEDSPKGKGADKGEEAGDSEDQAQDWLDDDLKAEVAAYGIDEKELADFTSREELERALRFFDRSALEAGRKALAETAKAEGEKKEPEPKSEPKEGQVPRGQYEVNLDKDVYDEDLVEELTRMRDHYEALGAKHEERVAAIEARFAEADAQAEEQRFDSLVDSLGHADLFGKSGKETAKELQRRQDLFVAAKAQRIGLQQLGRDVDLDESLVNRVARMVFAEELSKKDLKARTRKLSKQSDGRMGGGATRPSDPPETRKEEARRLYKELEGVG